MTTADIHTQIVRFTPAITVAVLAVLLAVAVATGGQVIARQIVSGLLLGAIYMTVAVAFTLTIGVLNFLNFTIPTLFMLAGMTAWGLMSRGYLTFPAARPGWSVLSSASRWRWWPR